MEAFEYGDLATTRKYQQQKAQLLEAHPGFGRDIWSWQPNKDKWNLFGQLPFTAPVTTQATLFHQHLYIGSGEIRAGVRTPEILHATILIP